MNNVVLKDLAESKKEAEFVCSVGYRVPIRGFIEEFSPDSDYVKVRGVKTAGDDTKSPLFHLKKSHIIIAVE